MTDLDRRAEPEANDPREGGPPMGTDPAVAARTLLLGVGLMMAGNGLQGSLLGVRSEAEGFSLTVIGVVMACYFAGFLAGTRYAESMLAKVGHIRVFAALASTASGAVLVHALVVSPFSWGAMRFLTGLCFAGLYVVSESWLNDLATNATRGRLLSMYMVATMGGMTAGQFLLEAADPGGFRLFVIASILVSASLLPITLSASTNPPLAVPETLSLRELAGKVPTGVVTSFWTGTSAGVLMGLGAVYAVAAGVSESRIPTFLAAPLAGSVVLQWPIGWLSDRMDRRVVMFWVAMTATAICALLAITATGSWLMIVLMFCLGGTTFPLYSLNIAYTADWLPQSQFTAASASLVFVNGVGAVVGPLVAAPVMSVSSPPAFFWTMVGTHGAIAAFIGWRTIFGNALPRELQRVFVAYPARASAVAANLIGTRRRVPRRRSGGRVQ